VARDRIDLPGSREHRSPSPVLPILLIGANPAGEDDPLLQLARSALIVAAPSRCGGHRGQLARRRRRGPAGPKSGRRRPARNVPEGPSDRRVLRRVAGQRFCCAALAKMGRPARARRAPRALEDVEKVLTRQTEAQTEATDRGDFFVLSRLMLYTARIKWS
jgi:hypothetical protein